jgi:hypothetical protein
MAKRDKRNLSTGILVVLFAGVLVSQALQAGASHQPADKFGAASSNVRWIEGIDGEEIIVLRETARVSSTSDLALFLTSECSLITSVTTGDEPGDQPPDSASAQAALEYYVTIDEQRVPVSTVPDAAGNTDDGEIIFCDRLFSQTSGDAEGDGDIDRLDTYEETRSAHGFNWLAINVGSEYDEVGVPAGSGNNIVVIEVHARFLENTTGSEAVADAAVGRTSLMVDPTHASVHEEVSPGTP